VHLPLIDRNQGHAPADKLGAPPRRGAGSYSDCMKLLTSLPRRNPLIVPLMQRHPGPHAKSAKQQRRRAAMALKKIDLLSGEPR
jgi:hypothetical protein